MSVLPPGTAPIKPEYLVSADTLADPDDDAAEGQTSRNGRGAGGDYDEGGPGKKRRSKEERKARQGQNKNRRFQKVRDELDICFKIAAGGVCEFGADCKYSHDLQVYLAAKPGDLRIPSVPELLDGAEATTTVCPVFHELGECKYGFKCRYLSVHVQKKALDDGSESVSLSVDEEKKAHAAIGAKEMNFVGADIQKLLRTKKYPFPTTDAYLRELQNADKKEQETEAKRKLLKDAARPAQSDQGQEANENDPTIAQRTSVDVSSAPEADVDTPDVPTRFMEKKRLDWHGKTYLAPLTTVGNLVHPSADSASLMEPTLLAGKWASPPRSSLARKRNGPCKPHTLVPTAEVLAREFGTQGGIDFVDINCGCPIDLVFKTGSGSALLEAPAKLGKAIIGMNKALGDIPVTIKLRTGVKDGKNTAEKVMTRAVGGENGWGVGCITLHGRTRQQRYTKLADWEYIKQCVEAVRSSEADGDLPPVPIFGNGDLFSSYDYYSAVERCGVDGVMAGRGALIKPWIFTEIKERREWDISSRERLDGIRNLAEYGLTHFGTDTSGVNTTRRYLCEALSFQYRYVPIGLLEVVPGKINERAPRFRGRDELETLLASPNSADWVKISEMFLGPAPEAFVFVPKHKSNSYETQG
ncbi:hypothetical protein D9757_005771 [Collybiopsis confluens]|uniref:tRNA-dihydrouridine(47) synthase [NAD(P)(+)] n=1 Tax=Collybiopsis confluens TaxID=2823264 RepID=A0A8H5MB10_9AGAR|nr:hypothetical protein D9757_005771 [Collybiopsis confluens]